MARYHLYFLRRGMLVGSGDVEASDEAEAARLAAEQSEGRTVEIWTDDRRISVVGPDAASAI